MLFRRPKLIRGRWTLRWTLRKLDEIGMGTSPETTDRTVPSPFRSRPITGHGHRHRPAAVT